jgi:phosphoribosylformimino-5-aminoimidazole carboxamide ribotide isomerase
MIELIPAIDIIEGSCVRLTGGDPDSKKDYGKNPVEMARFFEGAGFKRLHMVDLDGAFSGRPVHTAILAEVCKSTSLVVDFGGGIRTGSQVKEILEAGARMVSIGSIAVKKPLSVVEWINQFGASTIFLGADLKEGRIATHGWMESSEMDINEYLEYWTEQGIKKIFCTDVSRDGMLTGPSIDLYIDIKRKFPDIYLTASGGVSTVKDIEALEGAGIDAVIFGKAFYEGRIKVDELKRWL